jgi:hypothetical protein
MPKVAEGAAVRESIVTLRMSERERLMLWELAEHNGVSASDIIRMAVRRAHADLFGPMRKDWPKRKAKR